jgi:hypothetical protein
MIETLYGDVETGHVSLEESIAVSKRVGIPAILGADHTLRALAALPAGEIEEARCHLEIAADLPRSLEGTAYCLEGLAAVLLADGD